MFVCLCKRLKTSKRFAVCVYVCLDLFGVYISVYMNVQEEYSHDRHTCVCMYVCVYQG